jgi:hypothetical protein
VANDAKVVFDVVADAVTDTSTVVDLAPNAVPDVPAPTCSTGGVNWAKAWDSVVGLNASAVSPNGTPWATGWFSGATDFGTGTPLPFAGGGDSGDAFLVRLDPSSGLATQAFSFSDPSGRSQTGTGVAVAQAGNVVVTGNYFGAIDFTAAGSDTGNSGVDYLADSSVVQGAPMNFYVVVDGGSSGQYVTPLKAHNIDLGTGAILAVASNPSQNSVAIAARPAGLSAPTPPALPTLDCSPPVAMARAAPALPPLPTAGAWTSW